MHQKNSSPIGLGTDIIEIKRIKKAIARLNKRFLDTIFTKNEQHYCQKYSDPHPHFAARFAAKEAVFKALNLDLTPPISWLEIEVINEISGKPIVSLSSRITQESPKVAVLLSMSHCKEYATATAIRVS